MVTSEEYVADKILPSRVLTHVQPNVLVDDTGHARITNFGLATVTGDLSGVQTTPDVPYHNARWTAPEILRDGGPRSKQADVFSFAMVMIEVRYISVFLVGV